MSGARTRDCLDPWSTLYVHADGEVAACCWSRPVGNLGRESLERIAEGEAVRAMRLGLLTGALPEDCAKCPARATTTTRALVKQVERLARADEVAPDFAQRAGIRRAQQRLRELRNEEQALRGDAPERASREPRLRALAAAVAAYEAELTYALRKPRRAWLRRRLIRLLGIGRSAAGDRTASAAVPPAP